MRRFTDADIAKLKLMAVHGHRGTSIAAALGRTPAAVRVKCVELGIGLRPRKAANEIRFGVERETLVALQALAEQHGFVTVARLVRVMVEIVVRDRLAKAIVDAPPQPRPKAAQRKVDPLLEALGSSQRV